MYLLRTILAIAAVAALAASSGDCVSLLFADAHAVECCASGDCTKDVGGDDCCAVPSSGSPKYFQAAIKISDSHPVAIISDFVTKFLSVDFEFISNQAASFSPLHAPPLVSDTSLPLLI